MATATKPADGGVIVSLPAVKHFASDRRRTFLAKGKMKPEQAEIDRLRREVAKLKSERDILKGAAAAKDQT